ncbi:MAG: iron-sulfur cluster insertion protein ErpA [Anaerolineales bacterium]|jgi:iron-sulfur cluster assembly protein|nr:iron-sulfur cluster insertion protein ErpA [Anaerolineales bacterium]
MTTLDAANEAVVETIESEEITLTTGAREHVSKLLSERNMPDHGLRVFVSGGGCSGMQYGMALDAEPREFDTIVEKDGIKLFVDPTSLMYMGGASIDYEDNLMGGGFKIDNPQAVASCGCGHSFRTTDNAPSPTAAAGGCGSCG